MSRDFVNGKGLVCKRTGELPAFEEECDSFEQDKELERLAPPKPEDFPVFMTEEEMLAEENLPKGILCAKDSIILTLACGKYRFNDLDLGDIDGLPRIMDMGQCNDAYSAIKVAIALAEAFECDVNELPLSMVLSWYEQKAVCILLTLLHLGIKDIFLGPTLPAFISPNVLKILGEQLQCPVFIDSA